MSRALWLLAAMAVSFTLVNICSHFLPILLSTAKVKLFTHRMCPTSAISSCSCISRNRRASHSAIYNFPQYWTFPSFTVHSATGISFNPIFIWIASSIFPGNRPVTHGSIISSEIKSRPWVGGLSVNKCNCSSKFCSFRTPCSIYCILLSPPLREVSWPLYQSIRFAIESSRSVNNLKIETGHQLGPPYLPSITKLICHQILDFVKTSYRLEGLRSPLLLRSPLFETFINCDMFPIVCIIVAFGRCMILWNMAEDIIPHYHHSEIQPQLIHNHRHLSP